MDAISADGMVAGIMDNIRRIFQVINGQSKQAERETGLTWPQVWAMKIIGERAPLRVSDLAARMYLHPATVVGILDRLEKRGIVERKRSMEDRRAVEVDLTPEGRRLVAHSPEVASNRITHGLAALDQDELGSIHHGLARLVEILDADQVPPRLVGASVVNRPKKLRCRAQTPSG